MFEPSSRNTLGPTPVNPTRRLAATLLLLAGFAGAGCAAANRGKVYRFENGEPPKVERQRARAAYAVAQDQIALDDLVSARQNLEAATRYDPEYGRAWNNLGWLYFKEDNLYQAAWAFRQAETLLPREPTPLTNLALVMERGARWDEAVQLHERALRLDPGNVHYAARLARARVRRGDRDAETRDLLDEVSRRPPSAEWGAWAQKTRDGREADPPASAGPKRSGGQPAGGA